MWRSDSTNERNGWKRLQVIRPLGQFPCADAVPYLARIATQRVRSTYSDAKNFEYGQIRQAAGLLKRLMPQFEREIDNADPKPANLLRVVAAGEHRRTGGHSHCGRRGRRIRPGPA